MLYAVNRCRHKCQFMFKMVANGRMNGCLVDSDDDVGDGGGGGGCDGVGDGSGKYNIPLLHFVTTCECVRECLGRRQAIVDDLAIRFTL